jgi:diamine N-acetyltransferase
MCKMLNIEIISGSKELLEYVGPLWDKLNDHHKNNSTEAWVP